MTAPSFTPDVWYQRDSINGFLISPRGDPVPPPSVIDRLREISRRLSIEWVKSAWTPPYFALFERWREGDPRWAYVQNGTVKESQARDMLMMFPPTCSADELAAYVEHRWGERGIVADAAKEAERIARDASRRFAEHTEAGIEQAVETGTQRILDESDHTRLVRGGFERAHPMVPGAEFTEPKRLIIVEK